MGRQGLLKSFQITHSTPASVKARRYSVVFYAFHWKFPKFISGSAWHYFKVMGSSQWVCPTNFSIPLFSHSTVTDALLHIGDLYKTMKITVHGVGILWRCHSHQHRTYSWPRTDWLTTKQTQDFPHTVEMGVAYYTTLYTTHESQWIFGKVTVRGILAEWSHSNVLLLNRHRLWLIVVIKTKNIHFPIPEHFYPEIGIFRYSIHKSGTMDKTILWKGWKKTDSV